jgi:hypothetical protein
LLAPHAAARETSDRKRVAAVSLAITISGAPEG